MITGDELRILRKPKVQEYIREKMGKWEVGDLYYNPEIRRSLTVSMMWWSPCIEALYIPDCISRDSERPERGLWGMVDWKRWAISLGIDGSMVLDDMDDPSEGNRYSTDWNTPTLALLKALAWQEGV